MWQRWQEHRRARILAAARAREADEARAGVERAVSYARRGVVRDYVQEDGHWRRIGGWR